MRRLVSLFLFLTIVVGAGVVHAQPVEGVCTGFTSRLVPGTQARVMPGPPNNLRATPGTSTSDTRIGQIPGGAVFLVLEGPVCNNGVTWWQVQYGDLTGWTGEGNSSERWLIPATSALHAPRAPLDALAGTSASVLYSNALCPGIIDSTDLGIDELVYDPVNDSLRTKPGVCIPSWIADTVVAFTPSGTIVAADIYFFDYKDGARVTLPDYAYTIPGMWQLSINGATVRVNVLPAARPSLRGTFDMESQQFRLLLAGFQPGERVVLVTSNASASGYAVTPQAEALTDVRALDGSIRTLMDPAIIASVTSSLSVTRLDSLNLTSVLDMSELSLTAPESVSPTLSLYDESQLSLVLFDKLELADMSVIDSLDLGSGSGYTGGIFGMTLSSFDGIQLQADSRGYIVGEFTVPGNPIAAVGESGAFAIWPNLAQLSTLSAPGDSEALRAAVYASYWQGSPSEPTPCTYAVQRGDTLNKIAQLHGVSLQDVLDANPQITSPDVIHRGDLITIPSCG